jgi:DNA (cytosine-5)-methyltransferase 1
MSNFKFVELFAGIGGFRQGLTPFGGECVMAAEWDKYASQAYSILYGGDHLHGDVTKVNENDVPDHDLLVFGMPCQAFSVAGKRLGFEDMRGTLYFEAMRIAKVKKPKALWMENVKGLISHDSGRTLEVMAQAMSDIGYKIDFNVMNSKYFGVPQNRERIFMIGIRDDLVETAEWVVGKRSDVVAKGKKRIAQLGVKTFNFDWPAQNEVTVRLRDILESDVDEKFYLSEDKTAKLVAQLEAQAKPNEVRPVLTPDRIEKRQNGRRFKENDEESFTLTAQDKHGVALSEPQMLGHIDLKGHDAIKRVYSAEGVSPTLTTMGGGHREPKIAEKQPKLNIIGHSGSGGQKGHIYESSELISCLTATDYKQPKQIFGEDTKYRIRKLTPKECFLLQGFSTETFDKLTANGISNSQLYKMAGNAVTVNVIDAIGKRLITYLND